MGKSASTGKKKIRVSIARQAALKALKQVFGGQSLSVVQPRTIDIIEDRRDRGLANEIANGVLRWRWQLDFLVSCLLSKALKKKDHDVQIILLMALYELNECRTPDYAVINDAVELVRKTGKKWASGLVNAVLRRYLREKDSLLALHVSAADNAVAYYSHPQWMLEKISSDWPQNWQQIVAANNQRPAFWLRVNSLQYSVEQYQQLLKNDGIDFEMLEPASLPSSHAIKLGQGIDVRLLPGFAEGAISVQDAGAQLAADLLSVNDDARVLDLCAAPGGKTCHLLERYRNINQLVAIEIDEQRMQRVNENLQRLKLESRAELIVADGSKYQQWWQGERFDRILLDAPCSGSGVIRRHPDIKTLRRESDINQLVKLQTDILQSAWHLLVPGGELLYVTCSVFKDENQYQMRRFLENNSDATEAVIGADWGSRCEHGRQLFPGEYDTDGFYFCRLIKAGAEKG